MSIPAAPHIEQIPFGPLQTNCYLLGCTETRQAAYIDPSWDGHTLAGHAEDAGWRVTKILLTHTHFDHVAGLADLKQATGADVYAHPDAVPMLQAAKQAGTHWGVAMTQPDDPDQLLADGDVVAVGSLQLDVLLTPGHAPGHVSFYLRAFDLLFDGDVLFQGSIGRTDFPGCSHAELMRSIREKLLTLPDQTVVLSGHGPQTTIGHERTHNPFLR